MSEKDWDGKNRRYNPEICEMRFAAIEARAVENHSALERKLDAMSVRDERTSALVGEVRQKIFNGYSETLAHLANALDKIDRRMQWWIGISITFGVGLLTAVLLYMVTRA